MKTRRIIYILLLASFAAVAVPLADPVMAQSGPDASRVEQELKRTDEIIAEARTAVTESRSNKARLRIETAEAIQAKAHESFRVRAYRASLDLTMEARQEANQAMAIARLEVQTEARLGRIIEDTIERIGRVRDIAVEADITAERPMKLIDEARNLIEKSRLNASQYRYQLATKLAENAQQRATQAEKEIRQIRNAKEMTERRLALMERLLERAKERADETKNERAEQQLSLAERQLKHAQGLLQDSKYHPARMAIEQCEKTIRNLIRRLRWQSLSDPETELNEAYRLLERAEEMIERREGHDVERNRRRIEHVKRLLDSAEREIETGHGDEAKRLTAEIRRELREAVSAEAGASTEGSATTMIERGESMRLDVIAIVESCTAPGVETLLARATKHLDRAKSNLAEGKADAAAAEARIAHNMYNRIMEICSKL